MIKDATPLTLKEFRGLTRYVALEGDFGTHEAENAVNADLEGWKDVMTRPGLKVTDLEELFLRVMDNQIPVVDNGIVLAPDHLEDILGKPLVQAFVVASTVSGLLIEERISANPLATEDEKALARECRSFGFDILGTNLRGSLQEAERIAAILMGIENRLAVSRAQDDLNAPLNPQAEVA